MPKTSKKSDSIQPTGDREARGWLRAQHAGRWLAWTEDERRLIAAAETPEAVRIAAVAAGHGKFIDDWVPAVDSRQTTGLG